MLQDILAHPLSYAAGCLVWGPVAVWVISLVQWMIVGEIDVITGILGNVAAILLGVLAMNPPHPIIAPITFLFVFLTVVLYPVVRRVLHQRELRSIDIDSLRRAYEMLGEKGDNVGAQIRLARALYVTGRPGHALIIAEQALARMPQALFPEEHRMITQWRLLIRNPNHFDPVACPYCRHANEPGLIYCERCRRELFLGANLNLGAMATARRWIAAWFAAMAALLGIPSAATGLEPAMALAAIAGLLVCALAAVLWAFRREGASA